MEIISPTPPQEKIVSIYEFLLKYVHFDALSYKMSAVFHLDTQLVTDLIWEIIGDISLNHRFELLGNKIQLRNTTGELTEIKNMHDFIEQVLHRRIISHYFRRKIDKKLAYLPDLESDEEIDKTECDNLNISELVAQAHNEFFLRILPSKRAWFFQSVLNIDGDISLQELMTKKNLESETNMGLLLYLHYVQGLSQIQIAEAYGIPASTIRTRILRGKQHCHQEFALYYYLYTTPTDVLETLLERAVMDLSIKNKNGTYLIIYKLEREGNSVRKIAEILEKKEETVTAILTRINNLLDKVLENKAEEVLNKLSIQEIIEFFI